MRWCRTDPVQTVSALILTGRGALDRLAAAMARRAEAFGALPVETGEGWAAVFAAPPEDGTDPVLPWLPGATPLYRLREGWWLPVGMRFDVPEHAEERLLTAFAAARAFVPPVIVVPHVGGDADADVYPIRHWTPFRRFAATGARA